MLLELAIGDAYGTGFDFAESNVVRRYNDLKRFYSHPEKPSLPGTFTDKTQTAVAITEALLDPRPWSTELVAQCLLRTFKRDRREGHSSALHALLTRAREPLEFLRNVRSHSDKGDGAVRALPIGILKDSSQVLRCSERQAAITHNTPDGIRASQAASLLSHYFLYELGPKEELGPFLESHVDGDWRTPWRGQVGAKGWMSVQAAVTVLATHNRLSEILHASVALGGSTSVVAALALGAASCSKDAVQDLPIALIEGLEHGRFGRDYLVELDARLKKLFGARRSMTEE